MGNLTVPGWALCPSSACGGRGGLAGRRASRSHQTQKFFSSEGDGAKGNKLRCGPNFSDDWLTGRTSTLSSSFLKVLFKMDTSTFQPLWWWLHSPQPLLILDGFEEGDGLFIRCPSPGLGLVWFSWLEWGGPVLRRQSAPHVRLHQEAHARCDSAPLVSTPTWQASPVKCP